ncbi:MAG: hypothetical protein A2W31_03305 [Planctomycetes bacterium RBG_16_64_10]|nr:MAG: hypothetical protein A2W31_03305 [Planctomycetes bacterium RBG_16_64_10]
MVMNNGLFVDLEKSIATLRGQRLPLKALDVCAYGKDAKLRVGSVAFDPRGSFHLICVPHQRMFVLMDTTMFESALVRMCLFEDFDPSLFEPVDLNAVAHLYRLRI